MPNHPHQVHLWITQCDCKITRIGEEDGTPTSDDSGSSGAGAGANTDVDADTDTDSFNVKTSHQ
ncbi:hypothetical protein PHYBLDRAFT_144459 [Phycomyces blakesleeanus NRRL 1555(-)]|uniref:Uncharacterized protein n=1 Tax=Phycomyces blakesleeanus (strain ATCC 8743b / DSM 1359 / FGSC 10004 / NBRC 33097 / NRRL 1555) TaxID=763407 RepID=A0A162NKP1_PHYB8|nr:hypothetical protein PHYBLDRAFT_144459 [Phycomyces blakesleeanus NRRL 1555(-)]OAD75108.1 hypothetical protein PHYBLDRAFT_144459 [Phycomyces blakesleeanus NRRL 1555(-)]|eukprot:XP_018293148.1 hypothetical protein PHYBLDRAFT_144459 [Phycomyces blakesleeanus NRRL 1555(-)]